MVSNIKELTKGIIKENPTFVTLLGMCPTLAVTTMAINGIGMGLATMLVLIGSNIVISLIKNVVPKQVRLPAYIVVIAGFVTIIDMLLKAYIPSLHNARGLFLPLITVNCIILGRAEVYASKHNVGKSILDAIGMGIGFTLALFIVGSLREIFGAGTFMATTPLEFYIPLINTNPMTIFILPAGGFFVLGVVIAVVNKFAKRKPPKEMGCASCPNAKQCASKGGHK